MAARWQSLTEMKAVLAISKELTLFVQNEMTFTAAIERPRKEKMLMKLRSDTLSVLDLDVSRLITRNLGVGGTCLTNAVLAV